MPKTKKISRKSSDTFTTFRNETLTRKQLSQRIYKANKTWKNAYNFLSSKEYEQAKKYYFNTVETVMGKGKVSLGIEGIHDIKKLKLIEQASHKLLTSKLLNKKEYTKMRKGQINTLMDKFSTTHTKVLKNGKEKTIKEYLISEEDANRLRDIVFASDEWHHLVDNELLDSEQALKYFAEGGFLQSRNDAENIVNLLRDVEQELMSDPNASVDDVLVKALNMYNPYMFNER